ncbi:glycosyltransferase [bacterium]|nr:glycosyltransferase [bacterium]
MKWFLSQLGRREHYRLAVELHQARQLGALCTDLWAPWAAALPRPLRPTKWAQRYRAELAGAPVFAEPWLNVLRAQAAGGDGFDRWVVQGERFGAFAAEVFRRRGLSAEDAVLGYTCGNLEQLRLAREVGARAMHVQVDPGLAWYDTRTAAHAAHPRSGPPPPRPTAAFRARIQEEMALADCLIVHSPHTLRSLQAAGVDVSRGVVVPPAFVPAAPGLARTLRPGRPLRVLFVGNINLAKGFHVLAEALRDLGPDAVLTAVGGVQLDRGYLGSIAPEAEFTGHVSPAEVTRRMAQADVLVFPTLSDGFGLVQLEAMAQGLPVIATSACGEVVREGVDGFVVPPGDAAALADRLRRLRREPDLHAAMSRAALVRATEFGPARHLEGLMSRA